MKPRLLTTDRLSFPLATAIAAMLAAPSVFAVDTATSAWTGTTSVTWATTTNWTPNNLPSATRGALFGSAFTGANQPQLGATATAQGIHLADGATQDVTITGLTSARTLNITGTAELGGQTNAGILLNDVSGVANNNLTIGNLVTTTLTNSTGFYVNSAGVLTLQGSGTLNLNAKTLTLGGTNASGTTNIAQVISSATGAILVNTSGTATLSGINTYGTAGTNGTTLTAGTLNLNNANAVGAGTFTINGGKIDTTNATAGLTGNNNAQIWGGNFEFKGTSSFNLGTGTVDLNGGTRTVTTTANTLTVGGIISNGGLTKAGNGTLSLSGANTYTGGTSISAGMLQFAKTNSMAATGTVGVGTGGVLAVNAGGSGEFTNATSGAGSIGGLLAGTGGQSAPVTWTGTVALGIDTTNASGSALTYSGNIANLGTTLGLTKLGANTLTLSGTNTYSGATLVNAGTLTFANTAAKSSGTSVTSIATSSIGLGVGAGSGDYTAANVADLFNTNTLGGFNLVAGSGVAIDTTAGNFDQTVALTAARSLTKQGTNSLTLSGANSYSGTTFVGQGTLAFGADQSLTGGLTLGSAAGSTTGVALDLSAASATFGAAVVRTNNATANTATIGSGKTLTLNGGLTMGYDAGSGTGATASNLTISGPGALVIGGATINIGVQQAANNATYWNTATLDLTALGSGGTGFSTNVTDFKIGVSGDGNTHDVGTVLLSNAANTLLATNLTVGQTGTSNGTGSSSLVLGSGTNVLQVDTLTIGSGKGASPLTGLVNFASQTAGSAGTVSISNKLGTGAATIVIADNTSTVTTSSAATGTLDLRGHVATVSAGTVRIGRLAMNGNSGSTVGTLSFDAGTFTVATLSLALKTNLGTGTANATVNVGGGSFTVNTAFTLGSQATAGKSVATLNLTGGVFTSNVDILDGGGTTTSTINLNGGTLDMNGRALGSATVAIDALNFNSGTLKNVSQINNGAGLTKATGGTLILDGTNTYTGATNVPAGKLSVASTGTITSDVIIGTASTPAETEFNYNNSTTALSNSVSFASGSTGGILSGTGTITPAVTVTTGNRQTSGTSVTLSNPTATLGTEAFGTSIDYQAGSIFEWNLTANATTTEGIRGTNYDAVDTVSLLNTGADAIFRVVLNDTQNFSETFWNADRTWTDIFKNAGSALNIETIFGTGSTVEYHNSTGMVANANSTGRSFSISGTTLTWSAVPEPSSALAGLLLATGLLRRRRNG